MYHLLIKVYSPTLFIKKIFFPFTLSTVVAVLCPVLVDKIV